MMILELDPFGIIDHRRREAYSLCTEDKTLMIATTLADR